MMTFGNSTPDAGSAMADVMHEQSVLLILVGENALPLVSKDSATLSSSNPRMYEDSSRTGSLVASVMPRTKADMVEIATKREFHERDDLPSRGADVEAGCQLGRAAENDRCAKFGRTQGCTLGTACRRLDNERADTLERVRREFI